MLLIRIRKAKEQQCFNALKRRRTDKLKSLFSVDIKDLRKYLISSVLVSNEMFTITRWSVEFLCWSRCTFQEVRQI